MNLSEKVRQYYLDHFTELPEEKQFHFASRLSAWSSDKECIEILENMRPKIVSNQVDIAQVLSNLVNNPPQGVINALESRQPYFDAYPKIRGIMMALFRVRHLLYIYNIDVREKLLEVISLEDLRALSNKLASDGDALRILSTYAINCIYLIDRILYSEAIDAVNTSYILGLKDNYNLSKPEDIQLFIYLYTHCIIGESNFYIRHVSGPNAGNYIAMLKELEQLINAEFENINLDNKLEFLVCCKICNYQTPLYERIMEECEKSVSPIGLFLIDTVNNFKQTEKSTLALSEHRNVLFIMSTSDYSKV